VPSDKTMTLQVAG